MAFNRKFIVTFFVFLFVLLFWSSFCVLVVVIFLPLKVNLVVRSVCSKLLSTTQAWSVFKYLYNQLSLFQLFLIFFSSHHILLSLSLCLSQFYPSPSLFPPFSHSRLTIAVADLVMCPFFPFCSWQILYFLFFVNAIKFISRSGLHMDNFCPLSNPFQHECISAPSTVFIQPNYWEKLLPSPCTCAIWM